VSSWLRDLERELIADLVNRSRTLNDEVENLSALIERTAPGAAAEEMTLGQFSGCGDENDRINLSTLHSAKGREFKAVIMFAMDNGRLPWRNVAPRQVLESRRLFYVGFTRAKMELHLMFTAGTPSPFVVEVQERLEEEQ
jgi:superfamily I DNA/RNA helicase